MRNPQFYVSGKRYIGLVADYDGLISPWTDEVKIKLNGTNGGKYVRRICIFFFFYRAFQVAMLSVISDLISMG